MRRLEPISKPFSLWVLPTVFGLVWNIFFRVFQTRRISDRRSVLVPLGAVKDTQKDIPSCKIS